MAKLAEESEELHQKFLEKDIDPPTFVQKYKKLRTAYHKQALLHLAGQTSLRWCRVGETIGANFVVYLLAHSCSTVYTLVGPVLYVQLIVGLDQTSDGDCMYSYVVWNDSFLESLFETF